MYFAESFYPTSIRFNAVVSYIEMYKFSTLHEHRFDIVNELSPILRTGDILYTSSNAYVYGLPFSKLLERGTNSDFSHASTCIITDELYIVQVDDRGTVKYRLIDWLDWVETKEILVYRLIDWSLDAQSKLFNEIQKVLNNDEDYDTTFTHANKVYCTEATAMIYKNAGYTLVEPEYIKDIVKYRMYIAIKVGNPIFDIVNCSLPLDIPVYYVGNKETGLMSSKITHCVYKWKLHDYK